MEVFMPTLQPSLFADLERHTWTHGELSWDGEPFWPSSEHWIPCDLGEPSFWRCSMEHGIAAACSVVYRLTHPVHRSDLPTCHHWPCNGRRCQA